MCVSVMEKLKDGCCNVSITSYRELIKSGSDVEEQKGGNWEIKNALANI